MLPSKFFKTTLTEFKQRQQFLHGDRRYEHRVGRQNARKLVVLWAEKEAANLHRMERAGLLCPRVVIQHKHILVMSFIGNDAKPAPKLKDAMLSRKATEDCLQQVRSAMWTMYNTCMLVHADLSEYNLLYHQKKVYFIDVGQSVIPSHPRGDEFLYRDCVSIVRFFKTTGIDNVPTAPELFQEIAGRTISSENAVQYVHTLNVSKRAPKRHERENNEDTSEVCVIHSNHQELELERVGSVGSGQQYRDISEDAGSGQQYRDSSEDEEEDVMDVASLLAATMWLRVASSAILQTHTNSC